MPRYEPGSDDGFVSGTGATSNTLPKGEYEFIVGEPKPFAREIKNGDRAGEMQHGVGFPLKVARVVKLDDKSIDADKLMNKGAFMNCGMDSDGAQNASKRFLIACDGYKMNEEGEKEFNESHKGQDRSYDTEEGDVGDFWRHFKGSRVVGTLDVTMAEDGSGKEYQKFKKWTGISHVK